MNNRKHLKKCLTLLTTSLFWGQASAELEVQKYSINNSSTTMQSGDFEVRSSIGQVDASNKLIGSQFELTGGFWTAIEPQKNNDLIFKDDFE